MKKQSDHDDDIETYSDDSFETYEDPDPPNSLRSTEKKTPIGCTVDSVTTQFNNISEKYNGKRKYDFKNLLSHSCDGVKRGKNVAPRLTTYSCKLYQQGHLPDYKIYLANLNLNSLKEDFYKRNEIIIHEISCQSNDCVYASVQTDSHLYENKTVQCTNGEDQCTSKSILKAASQQLREASTKTMNYQDKMQTKNNCERIFVLSRLKKFVLDSSPIIEMILDENILYSMAREANEKSRMMLRKDFQQPNIFSMSIFAKDHKKCLLCQQFLIEDEKVLLSRKKIKQMARFYRSDCMLLTLHTTYSNSKPISCSEHLTNQSLINVWNFYDTSSPVYTLVGEGIFTVMCVLNQENFRNIIICGTLDGGINTWDITNKRSEKSSRMERKKEADQKECRMSFSACYRSTFMKESLTFHQSSIVDLLPLEQENSSTCMILSIDRAGQIIMWKLRKDNTEAPEQLNWIRIIQKQIHCGSMFSRFLKVPLRLIKFPSDRNKLLVAFSNGDIEIQTLYGEILQPKRYALFIEANEVCMKPCATKIKFSIFFNEAFLVGWDNFNVSLFITSLSVPIKTWDLCFASEESKFCPKSNSMVDIQWSPYKSTVFFILIGDDFFLFDLSINDHRPLIHEKIKRKFSSQESSKDQFLFDQDNGTFIFLSAEENKIFSSKKLTPSFFRSRFMSTYSDDISLQKYIKNKMKR